MNRNGSSKDVIEPEDDVATQVKECHTHSRHRVGYHTECFNRWQGERSDQWHACVWVSLAHRNWEAAVLPLNYTRDLAANFTLLPEIASNGSDSGSVRQFSRTGIWVESADFY